jgi:hypothetical protein
VIESQLRMKRTLLAIGIAVLISMMLMPRVVYYNGVQIWLPFFVDTAWLPANWHVGDIQWTQFILQTVFVAVAAAVIVNLLPHRPRR